MLRPFERPQYRRLALGLLFALFADGIWTMAVVWQVIDLGGGAGQVSIVSAVSALGMMVSTLGGGVLADRVSQRLIIIALEVLKVVAVGTAGVAAFTGHLTFVHLVGVAAISGVTTGVYYPAYSALLPNVVAAQELQAANGVEGFLRPVVFQALGPVVAGAAIAIASPGLALIVSAGSSVGAALCYLSMKPIESRVHSRAAASSIIGDVVDGFRYMWRTPWLWATLFFATFLVLLTMGPIEVLVPFAIRERVHGDAADHSLVLAAFGAGAAIGSLIFAAIPIPRRYLTIMFGLWGLCGVPLVFFGVAEHLWVFIVAALVLGVAFDGPMVLWGTLLQRRVPPELLGRVASLDFFVSVALMPVSMALAAPVADAIGLTSTFVLGGLLPLPFAIVFYMLARLWRDELANPLREAEPVSVGDAQ
ncbi:MFS transporter [Gordonia sp. TBRC 11910]|uniref:MFS transporter n=1 Tax=Gordonia asplenii TaxID=2725283 RepID=A0A848KTU4_9ACTN|nr:MFS transporter [Gordonia asplenii]NMO01692.1 MFS transporter [Gordonia asplenii]